MMWILFRFAKYGKDIIFVILNKLVTLQRKERYKCILYAVYAIAYVVGQSLIHFRIG